jgi:phosphoenolpyruvate carboxykinase (ATP)
MKLEKVIHTFQLSAQQSRQHSTKTMFHAQAFVSLDNDFMVKVHLLIPEGEENIMCSWLLNFQYITQEYYNMYAGSKQIENESDIHG